ncbi:DNA polymerase III, partial [Candidatus Woesearchaeota archaeon]|nr:DNA polymerase III [Candidatus Woesearchaeota archaeon]
MKNQEIAQILYEMADILEMQGVEWKPRAYRTAARAIEGLSEPLEVIYKRGGIKELEELPGVGEGIAKKIAQYIETGKIKEYEKLKKQVPKHIDVLMKIPGMGPKKVKKLNKLLKISTIAQLEKAAHGHKISKLPGFKEKSEQDILEGIILMKKSKGKIPLAAAEKEADKIIDQLKKISAVRKISPAGSLRRKKPLVRDIDILVSSTQPKKVIDAFVRLKYIQKVLAKGPTKATIVLQSGIQADLRVLPPESWGS